MKRAIWVVAMVLPLLLASHAFAGGAALTLNRASLTNVTDAAGISQYEGGTIFRGTTQIGSNDLTRWIVTGGTSSGTVTLGYADAAFSRIDPGGKCDVAGSARLQFREVH